MKYDIKTIKNKDDAKNIVAETEKDINRIFDKMEKVGFGPHDNYSIPEMLFNRARRGNKASLNTLANTLARHLGSSEFRDLVITIFNERYGTNENRLRRKAILSESSLRKIIKESVRRILKETEEEYYLQDKDERNDNPFNCKKTATTKPISIKGTFFTDDEYYSSNPSKTAHKMMEDGSPFDDFIDWCESRQLNPYDYIDTNDWSVQMWIEDYV